MAVGSVHIVVGNAQHTAQFVAHGAHGNAAHQGTDGTDGQIAAHGAVALNNGGFCAAACGGNGSADTGRTAAHNDDIISCDYFQFFCITDHKNAPFIFVPEKGIRAGAEPFNIPNSV